MSAKIIHVLSPFKILPLPHHPPSQDGQKILWNLWTTLYPLADLSKFIKVHNSNFLEIFIRYITSSEVCKIRLKCTHRYYIVEKWNFKKICSRYWVNSCNIFVIIIVLFVSDIFFLFKAYVIVFHILLYIIKRINAIDGKH